MGYIIKVKRGKYDKLPSKIGNGELFYITDLNIFGIGDSNGMPQLLVDIVKCETKEDLPKEYKRSTLYYCIEDDKTYYYDLETKDYLPIKFNKRGFPEPWYYSFRD